MVLHASLRAECPAERVWVRRAHCPGWAPLLGHTLPPEAEGEPPSSERAQRSLCPPSRVTGVKDVGKEGGCMWPRPQETPALGTFGDQTENLIPCCELVRVATLISPGKRFPCHLPSAPGGTLRGSCVRAFPAGRLDILLNLKKTVPRSTQGKIRQTNARRSGRLAPGRKGPCAWFGTFNIYY